MSDSAGASADGGSSPPSGTSDEWPGLTRYEARAARQRLTYHLVRQEATDEPDLERARRDAATEATLVLGVTLMLPLFVAALGAGFVLLSAGRTGLYYAIGLGSLGLVVGFTLARALWVRRRYRRSAEAGAVVRSDPPPHHREWDVLNATERRLALNQFAQLLAGAGSPVSETERAALRRRAAVNAALLLAFLYATPVWFLVPFALTVDGSWAWVLASVGIGYGVLVVLYGVQRRSTVRRSLPS